MKKLAIAVCMVFILFLNNACRKPLKEVDDYFPVIKTVSAVVQDDGSVLVTGEVESEGKAKDAVIRYVGFCVSTGAEPKMLEKQLIAELSGSHFTGVYPASLFSVDSLYYFRTWGTNRYGYSYGNSIALDSIIAVPVTPPCNLAMNMVNIGGSQPTAYYDDIKGPSTDNSIVATSFNGPSVTFEFGSALTTGVYQTTTNSSPVGKQVFVSFYYQFISGALNTGSKVYVKKINSTRYEISICEAPWNYNSSTFYFNTRLTTP